MTQHKVILDNCFPSDTFRIVNRLRNEEQLAMTSEAATVSKRAPGRPRSDATQRAIVDATIELVGSENYPDVTIEKIAARAKVGKQSIYRWWPTKADLVLDAFTLHSLQGMPPVIQSADAFADLEQDIARHFTFMSAPLVAKGLRSLIAEAQYDQEFRRKLYENVHRVRCEALRRAFRHGIALGQIREDIDFDALAHMIHGAFWYRFLSGTVYKSDAEYAKNIVALLRPGIATASANHH